MDFKNVMYKSQQWNYISSQRSSKERHSPFPYSHQSPISPQWGVEPLRAPLNSKCWNFFNCLDFFCGLVQGYSSHVMSKRQHVTALSSSPSSSHLSLPRWSLSLRGAAIAVPSTAKRSQLFMAFGRAASRCTDRCSLRRAASLTRLKAAHTYRCKHM